MKKLAILVLVVVLFSLPVSGMAAQNIMVYGPEFFDEVFAYVGYVPTYECYEDQLIIHFANGFDFTTTMHWHHGEDLWLYAEDVEHMRQSLYACKYSYEWAPEDTFMSIETKGVAHFDGVRMPFEVGYSDYREATIVAYGSHVVEVDMWDCVHEMKTGSLYLPAHYFIQAYYLAERAEIEYIAETGDGSL